MMVRSFRSLFTDPTARRITGSGPVYNILVGALQ